MAFRTVNQQLSFLGTPEVDAAVADMASAGSKARGAAFTRREVVDFILDLAGYTADKPLHEARILEPSMGHGDFLLPVIHRLFESYRRETKRKRNVVKDLAIACSRSSCIRPAMRSHARSSQKRCARKGLRPSNANHCANRWLKQGDFLLLPLEGEFTHVIGNPPYVRQELIPDILMAE
jgi:type I restriction-modification system DNA methylase subunit